MKCPACNNDRCKDNSDEDLCPECMDLLREGGQEIILGKHDTAIILRSKDGESYTKEIYIQPLEDNDTIVNAVSLATVRYALGMDDQQVIDRCNEVFEEGLQTVRKSENQTTTEPLLKRGQPGQ